MRVGESQVWTNVNQQNEENQRETHSDALETAGQGLPATMN